MRLFRSFLAVLVIVASASIPAAAQTSGAFKHPMTQQRLAQRVDVLWNAWRARNLHGIFLTYSPSYRKTTSEAAFIEYAKGMLGIMPVEYTIAKVDFSDNGAKATVHLDAQTEIPPFGKVPNKLVQIWGYEQGDWYRLVDPPSFPTLPQSAAPSAAEPTAAPGRLPTDPRPDAPRPGAHGPAAHPAPASPATPANPAPSPSPSPRA